MPHCKVYDIFQKKECIVRSCQEVRGEHLQRDSFHYIKCPWLSLHPSSSPVTPYHCLTLTSPSEIHTVLIQRQTDRETQRETEVIQCATQWCFFFFFFIRLCPLRWVGQLDTEGQCDETDRQAGRQSDMVLAAKFGLIWCPAPSLSPVPLSDLCLFHHLSPPQISDHNFKSPFSCRHLRTKCFC